MLNERLSDFGARNFTYPGSKGSALKPFLFFKMWPLERNGGWVRQTRSFDWKIMRREYEMFLSPLGALCHGMPHGYVAYR
jgi:hypothetical protein